VSGLGASIAVPQEGRPLMLLGPLTLQQGAEQGAQ
jgi:hypothetical protein